jgi:hypothetical protein
VEVRLKLTAKRADALAKAYYADDSVSKSDSEGVSLYASSPDPANNLFLKEDPKNKLYHTGGTTFNKAIGDGADLEFYRTATSTGVTNNAMHNTVRVLLPENASTEDVEKALEALQVNAAPASEGDIHVYAENKLMAVMGADTDVRKNFSGEEREKKLAEIKKKYGVEAKDLIFTVDANGRNKFFLPDAVRDKLIKDLNVKGFHHNMTASSADDIMSILAGTNPGLNATQVRWNNGIFKHGMSSPSDMASGGADYLFTTPKHSGLTPGSSPSYSNYHVTVHPKAAMRRLDIYGNQSDSYGRHKAGTDVYALISGNPYEIVFKDSIPLSDMWYMNVPNHATREELIKRLKAMGITQINGIPIEDFLVGPGGVIPVVDETQWDVIPLPPVDVSVSTPDVAAPAAPAAGPAI